MKAFLHTFSNEERRKRFILLLAFLIIAVGIVIGIMNIESILPGPWINILQILFTGIGLLLALFQLGLGSQAHMPLQELKRNDIDLCTDKHRGALIIRAKKQDRGTSMTLHCGFDLNQQGPKAAATVSYQTINGRSLLIGVFPSVEPGNYTIISSSGSSAQVTVYPEQVTEIDWR